MDTIAIVHEPENNRFVAVEGDQRAGYVRYRVKDDVIDLYSTEVDPKFEGRGVGGRLAAAGFQYAREKEYRTKMSCWFQEGWAKRHPEVNDLVSDEAAQPEVVVLGESLVDLLVEAGQDGALPVGVPGGSPANVAVTLSRLGIRVDLATWIGQDEYGRQVAAHLAESHVRLTESSDRADSTSTAQTVLAEDGSATYTFNLEWAPAEPIEVPASAQVVHTGSLAAVLQPGAAAVLSAFRKARGTALLTYDPNVRSALMGTPSQALPHIEAFVKDADVVKVSEEDLEWLYPGVDARQTAKDWVDKFRMPLLVLTEGPKGALAWTRGGAHADFEAQPVTVVDTVGAGDSFMGGLIDALWRRELTGSLARQKIAELDEAELGTLLSEATRIADVVVQRRGANPPWKSELV